MRQGAAPGDPHPRHQVEFLRPFGDSNAPRRWNPAARARASGGAKEPEVFSVAVRGRTEAAALQDTIVTSYFHREGLRRCRADGERRAQSSLV